jgi:Protein of unknown function (DUF3006)
MNHIVLENLEGELARLELPSGELTVVPREWLPTTAREGDHLTTETDGEGLVKFTVDAQATRQALARNQNALEALNANDQGGDLTL